MTVSTTGVVEPENAGAGRGAVVLDIGDDVGALVVVMPASMLGLEVEIRPLDGQSVPTQRHGHHHDHSHGDSDRESERLAHVAVVARPVADGHVPSLVFPELPSGRYELFEKGCPDRVVMQVEVTGGSVTTTHWWHRPAR